MHALDGSHEYARIRCTHEFHDLQYISVRYCVLNGMKLSLSITFVFIILLCVDRCRYSPASSGFRYQAPSHFLCIQFQWEEGVWGRGSSLRTCSMLQGCGVVIGHGSVGGTVMTLVLYVQRPLYCMCSVLDLLNGHLYVILFWTPVSLRYTTILVYSMWDSFGVKPGHLTVFV